MRLWLVELPPPQHMLCFASSQYEATVPENKVGALVAKMPVDDGDEPNSPAWNAKFKIVSGDPDGYFTVETGPNKNEGIVKTAKVRGQQSPQACVAPQTHACWGSNRRVVRLLTDSFST